MRKHLIVFALCTVALCALPATAKASFTFSASVGQGLKVSPGSGWQNPNIMLAPGYSFLDLLRVELGIVSDIATLKSHQFDLQLRPSLVISPPFPVYARVVVGVANLLHSPDVTWGGGLGAQVGLGPIGAFLELDVLPQKDAKPLILEARLGVGWF